MAALHDMHCHLSFIPNGEEVAARALKQQTLLFTNTVTPADWAEAHRRFGDFPNVAVGFGMHPWWVGNRAQPTGTAQIDGLKCEEGPASDEGCRPPDAQGLTELLERHQPRIIGEIGLDFGKHHEGTRDEQVEVLSAAAEWAAQQGGCLISLHSVHAAAETLDILRGSGALESCTCIFHWFTGPSDLLKQGIEDGCHFSCGPRMLRTGKGREYVKAIPAERLLLETDAPAKPGEPFSFDELHAQLEAAAQEIAAIKGAESLRTISEAATALIESRQ